jgi:cob(I)alamin adenosyltransferase
MADTKGLVMINTGPGKGKTTAGLGAALRASGAGLKVLIIQFIKGKWRYGELSALERLDNVDIRPMGLGLMGKNADIAPHKAKAAEAFEMASSELASGKWDLIILDELCFALHKGLIEVQQVLELLDRRPHKVHMILTGRGCPQELIKAADMVTKFEAVKHHLQAGVEAQRGIEF